MRKVSLIKKVFNEIIPRRDEYGYPPYRYNYNEERGRHHHHDNGEHHHHHDNCEHHHDDSGDIIPKNEVVPYSEVIKKQQVSDEEIEKIIISLEDDKADSKNTDKNKEEKNVAQAEDKSKEGFVPKFKKTIHSKLTIVLLEKTNADIDVLAEFLPKMIKNGDVVFILYGEKIDVTSVGKASEINVKNFFETGIPTTKCRLYDAINSIPSIINKYRFKFFENEKERIMYDSFEILGVGKCIENGSSATYEETMKSFLEVYKDPKVITKYFCITDEDVCNAAKIGFRSIGALSTEY